MSVNPSGVVVGSSKVYDTNGSHTVIDSLTVDGRPWVALDLPDGARAGWPVLVDALRKARELTGYHMVFSGLIEQIEAQTTPPKPDEPTGMGAVVEDDRGERYVGLGDHYGTGQLRWKGDRGMTFTSYDRINAVKVLSEGVSK